MPEQTFIYVQYGDEIDMWQSRGWHIDDLGYLHILRRQGNGNIASYAPGCWRWVGEKPEEPHVNQRAWTAASTQSAR